MPPIMTYYTLSAPTLTLNVEIDHGAQAGPYSVGCLAQVRSSVRETHDRDAQSSVLEYLVVRTAEYLFVLRRLAICEEIGE